MKTATDKLFRLIKSMSPAEKRYYKRHYGSSANTLTDLFDVINAQRVYQEEAVKEAFSGKVATNLKVYKFQLEQQLLQSLVSYRYFSNVGSKIRQGLEQVEILAERNLIDMALKQLEKTKQLCLSYEEFPYLLDVASKEFQLHFIRLEGFTQKSHPTFDDHQHYLDILQDLNKLTVLINEIADFVPRSQGLSSKERKSLEKYLEHPLLQQVHEKAPIRTAFGIAQAKGNVHTALGQHQQALGHFEKAVALFQTDKNLKEHYAYYYLLALRYSIHSAIKAGDHRIAKKRIEEANQYIAKQKQYVSQLLYIVRAELELSVLTGGSYLKQHQLERRISRLNRHLPAHQEGLIEENYVLLAYNLILLKKYPDALDYVQMLATGDKVSFSRVREVTAFLEMVIHLEQDDKKALKEVLRNHLAHGTENDYYEESAIYQAILDLFEGLAFAKKTPSELAGTVLKAIEKNPEDRVARQLKDYHLVAWLQSQAESKPVTSILSV